MKYSILVCFLLMLQAQWALAQTAMHDSVKQLPHHLVQDNRIPEANPGLSQTTFSTHVSGRNLQSLAEIISRNSASFIRQYSPGTLSSPSIRGTGAAHTALVWNGLNLQSSMNGQLDLSLVPAILFDHFSLQSGAGAASWGTGAIGGTMHLASETSPNHVFVQQAIGSFGFRQTALDLAFKKGRFAIRTRLFDTQVKNDFPFVNTALYGHPKQNQINAAQAMKGWMQDVTLQTGKHSHLQLALWGQSAHRQIPPIETIPVAAANQSDDTWRAMFLWKRATTRWDYLVRTGFLQEGIRFNDSLLNMQASNNAQSYIAESEVGKHFSAIHSRLQVGFNSSYSLAKAQGYGNGHVYQNRSSVFASFRTESIKGKLITLIQARQEWFNASAVPFIPSVSAAYSLAKGWKFRGQIARSFRVPTLNDLYWQPGGNPSLKPESGIASELGGEYHVEKPRNVFHAKAGAFSNHVNNWIVWLPSNSFWTPLNVPQVFSRGAEMGMEWHHHFKSSHSLHFSSNAQYVWVTASKTANGIPVEVGKQLVYVPHFTWNGRSAYRWKDVQVELTTTFTGERYITSDNSSALPGYFLLNASVTKEVKLKAHLFSLFFNAFNVLKKSYQVIAWRPMPMYSFQTGLSYTFQPNPKK